MTHYYLGLKHVDNIHKNQLCRFFVLYRRKALFGSQATVSRLVSPETAWTVSFDGEPNRRMG